MKRTCDETKLAPESPPKRVLFSSSSATAVKFLLSPKILPALDAIRAKEQEPERVKLMPVENKEISLEEARTRAEGGQDILVSPRGLNTNAEFARMREVADLFKGLDMKLLRDFFEGLDESSVYANLLYKSMVGASSEVCEADLIKITSSCLDYYVKSKFQGDAAKYDGLVGQGLAFSSSSGDNIMYSRLLSFVDNKMHAPDLCSLGKELLFAAESELLQDIGMHHTDPDRPAEHVRKSMRDFSRSLLRKERLTSAHLLSEVLFVDCHRPINEQDLSHKFHKVKDNLWNMDDPRVLFKTGVRVMVLEDLKRKFETVGLREGYLLYHIGLNVMQYFLQEKVPFSMGFTFGNLKVFVKKAGQEVSLDHNYDLSTLKQALPPI